MTVTESFGITYTTRGIVYTLSGADTHTGLTFQYLGDQGFGLAPLHRITTRGPLQDGDSDIDFRLDPRVLQLPLMVVNTSTTPRYQHYEIREKLLQIFRPQNSGVLAIQRTGGPTKNRKINVRVLGGLSFDVEPDSWHVRTVVQLRASDPTWYDDSVSNSLTVPQANFGVAQNVTNDGNWNTFPIITIAGPVTNFKITNNTTGQFIELTGTIASGVSNVVKIDLSYGKKTVTNNSTGANLISTVTPASNLATWSLQPGVNSITMTGTGLTAGTSVTMTWFDRFTGI
jgi:hypothetical protein